MTKIKFTKMNGLGNDFVVLDFEEHLPKYFSNGLIFLCHTAKQRLIQTD